MDRGGQDRKMRDVKLMTLHWMSLPWGPAEMLCGPPENWDSRKPLCEVAPVRKTD
jgi:hypothetical protein